MSADVGEREGRHGASAGSGERRRLLREARHLPIPNSERPWSGPEQPCPPVGTSEPELESKSASRLDTGGRFDYLPRVLVLTSHGRNRPRCADATGEGGPFPE